jgi:NADP-dependent 3-hydroxy acid dehydrogenase YdfG
MLKTNKKNCIIFSISSDIGLNLAKSWCNKGWKIFGTYRKITPKLKTLSKKNNIPLLYCDLLNDESIKTSIKSIKKTINLWDVLVFCFGTTKPIGAFQKIDFDDWQKSIEINFIKPLKILHSLLPQANIKKKFPTVLFFAGGGTNNAVLNYSSYTLSKISLIKMCELLDIEMPDIRFVILGPGWVRTKIHNETLKDGLKSAKENYYKTTKKLKDNDFVDMQKVINCCNWIVESKSKGINGRNFSVEYDDWQNSELEKVLENDFNMYKLRRFKNDLKI